MRAFTAALFAVAASLVSAVVTPVGDPSGNPISKPGLNEIVPAGAPYAITWSPTTVGPVTILLLRGPSTNVVPIATLVEHLDNTGTYSWTPDLTLEDDVTHYGLQLIVEATGQYQFSTQFGISNPGVKGSSSSGSAGPTGNATSTATPTTTDNSTATATTLSTSSVNYNTTSIQGTGSLTIQTTLYSSPTAAPTTPIETQTAKGAAGQAAASFGSLFLAVAAGLQFAF
ncbi:MAG: hypothetical protein M1839_002844 [Geoglossum umbratile]|nr:MAG: hypothetical protein M1839_002844 [Geoglossum umbratile]